MAVAERNPWPDGPIDSWPAAKREEFFRVLRHVFPPEDCYDEPNLAYLTLFLESRRACDDDEEG